MAERHQFVFGGDTNFGSRQLAMDQLCRRLLWDGSGKAIESAETAVPSTGDRKPATNLRRPPEYDKVCKPMEVIRMSAIERMTITIPSEMAATVRQAVAGGEYASWGLSSNGTENLHKQSCHC